MPETFETRREQFLTEYKALIDKLKVDFMSTPVYAPNDKGTWDLTIHVELKDMTEIPVPSPIQM